jgi:membrane protein DedA with SNARE-associated domain
MTHLIDQYGLAFLFAIVALESMGAWVPGETALIAAGVWASRGHLSITAVIAVAAVASILGDNAGYWIGRTGGRKLIYRWERLGRLADRVLPRAEAFFERHGPKTIFLARFVTGIRVTAAWMAGISRMPWWSFLAWNAAGGVAWATGVGLLAFYGGHAAASAFSRYGIVGVGALLALVAVVAVGLHLFRRRAVQGT